MQPKLYSKFQGIHHMECFLTLQYNSKVSDELISDMHVTQL